MLARRFSQRVRRLRAVSQRLAGGLLEARTGAPPSGGDEITALGRDFDRMAERLQILIESRIRLLRDLSHELRSPLARLQTALELARARPTTAASYLDRIEREIERLDGLIGQALSLARLEAGIEPFHYTTIDLAALLAEICADARFEHATRSDRGAITAQGAITSQGTTTPEDENGSGDLSPLPREEAPEGASVYLQEGPAARLQGDRRLLRSALENIVRNAVYHTPPSGAVEVSWRWETAERLNISVTDAGPGVAEADLPRLFEPFQRLEGSPGHEYAGHGLGLAIAKRAIEAHGGSVRAENRSGGGLHLAVELPTNA
nr:ATP-binding protein [Halorhodospira abdelmalekii]